MEFIFIVILLLLCGALCCNIAQEKGRSGAWFWAGLFTGIIGVLFIVIASDLNKEKERDEKLNKLFDEVMRARDEQRFRDAAVLGTEGDVSLCGTCGNMGAHVGICREFNRRDIRTAPVLKCTSFVERKKPDPTAAK